MLKNLLETYRQDTITAFQDHSLLALFFKFIFHNYINIFLIVAFLVGMSYFYLQNEFEIQEALQEEIGTLNQSLDKMRKDNVDLQNKVKAYYLSKTTAAKEVKKNRVTNSKLTAGAKKKVLLDLRDGLMKRRAP